MMAHARPSDAKVLNLALQGGGAHGAYTWGVLDRLLEDERIVIEGISATSAGAMNGAALAQGLADGGTEGARKTLERFWRRVSLAASTSPLQPTWLDRWFGNWNMDYSPAYLAFDLLMRTFSPNQFNPLDLDPLRDLLVDVIDFERLRACTAVKLFVSATNVRTGKIKVFKTEDLSADVLMASACLPFLHRTVEVDGAPYRDGGYMGNPAIFPLIYDCVARDIVIVRINNPMRREDLPRTARDILNRVNEISFNSSLMRELRAIGFVTQLIDRGLVADGSLKRVLVHGIDAEEYMAELGYSSKLNPTWISLFTCAASAARARIAGSRRTSGGSAWSPRSTSAANLWRRSRHCRNRWPIEVQAPSLGCVQATHAQGRAIVSVQPPER